MKRLAAAFFLLASTLTTFQSCSKRELGITDSVAPKPSSYVDAIDNSTGLNLKAAGDYGIYPILDYAGDCAGIPAYTE